MILKSNNLLAAAGAAALAALVVPGIAQGTGDPDPRADEMRQLRKEVDEQRAVIARQSALLEKLQKQLDAFESRDGSAPLASLESAIAELKLRIEERNAQATRPGSSRDAVSLGGYFTLVFEDRMREHSTFNALRLVPQLEAPISDWLHFGTEVEIEHGGAGADFLDDDEIVIEYAQLTASVSREFNLRAGVLLVPFLSYNQRHDDPLHDLTDRPYTAVHLVPTAFGQPGVGAFGGFDACANLALNYDLTLTNGFDGGFDSFEGARGARSPFQEDNNNNKLISGRFGFVPRDLWFDSADVGLSFLHGKYDDENARRIRGYGFDAYLRKGCFDIRGEWGAFDLQRKATALHPDDLTAFDSNLGIDNPPGLRGWYVEGAVHFFPFPESWKSKSPFSRESECSFIVRVQEMDLNTRTIGATPTDDQHATAIGFAFRPTARTVIRVSYEWVRSPFRGPDGGNDALVASISSYF
jgi:hypothetical protein